VLRCRIHAGGEVAVSTLRPAKGYGDVEAKGSIRHKFHH
jgi:hypothetical protein